MASSLPLMALSYEWNTGLHAIQTTHLNTAFLQALISVLHNTSHLVNDCA